MFLQESIWSEQWQTTIEQREIIQRADIDSDETELAAMYS